MNWTPDERMKNALNERDYWAIQRAELQEAIEYAEQRLDWWRDEVRRLADEFNAKFSREVAP